MDYPTFTLSLTRMSAWAIQQAVKPLATTATVEQRRDMLHLRRKINDAILRFEDEPETLTVEIDVYEKEAWIIDQAVAYDGTGGHICDLLLQLFRGLWSLEYGLPATLVPEPKLEVPS